MEIVDFYFFALIGWFFYLYRYKFEVNFLAYLGCSFGFLQPNFYDEKIYNIRKKRKKKFIYTVIAKKSLIMIKMMY